MVSVAEITHVDHSAPGRIARARSFLRRHRVFAAAFALGGLLRLITMLGYGPAMWFNDSYEYVSVALHPRPHPIRPDGYGFWLLLLKPFHSFTLVTLTQHLMGLATAALIYALLRRKFGLPKWGATLAAAPVLFDAYQIQLEQLIMSDAHVHAAGRGRDHAGAVAPADVVAGGRGRRAAAGAHRAHPLDRPADPRASWWSTCSSSGPGGSRSWPW